MSGNGRALAELLGNLAQAASPLTRRRPLKESRHLWRPEEMRLEEKGF